MKNLFKKAVKKEVKSNVQKLDKKQLEKVIGGSGKGGKSDGLSADQSQVKALDGNPTV
jgi:hypothetical protein